MLQNDYCCKLGRVADRHSLSDNLVNTQFNEDLLNKWIGRGEYTETSVRVLTDRMNKNILKAVYRENGREIAAQYIETDYEALQNDEHSQKGAVEYSLQQHGIDPDDLMDEFISSATLYRHLTDCLDASKTQQQTETESESGSQSQSDSNSRSKPESESNWERESIAFSKVRAADTVEDALHSLDNKNELPGAAAADVEVSIYLNCPECSTSVPVESARARGYICKDHVSIGTGASNTTRKSDAEVTLEPATDTETTHQHPDVNQNREQE